MTDSPKLKESHRRHAHDEKKKEHTKKNKYAAAFSSLPSGLSCSRDDFALRMANVPGSSPGCTAGAYSNPYTLADAQGDSDVGAALSEALPSIDSQKLRDWASDNVSSPLVLLGCAGKDKSVWAAVNAHLVKRVRRKDDSLAAQRMGTFVCDCVSALRSVPTFPKTTLYRAVPNSAMGYDAPSRDEFGEDCNIVWPVFSALTPDEKAARSVLSEGGFLFQIETERARDVASFVEGCKSGEEFWLEPNAEFLITSSGADSSNSAIFVVQCKQNWPSARPIAGDLPEKFRKGRKISRQRSGSTLSTSSDIPLPGDKEKDKSERDAVKVVVRVASEAAVSGGASRGDGSSGALFSGSSRSSGRRGTFGGRGKRPTHRVQCAGLGMKGVSMTVWTAVKGNVRVKSVKCREDDKVIDDKEKPSWAHLAERDIEKEKAEEEERKKAEKAEAEKKKKKAEEAEKKKREEREKEKEEEKKKPGFGSMSLFPNELPTAIITQDAIDSTILGAVDAESARSRAQKGKIVM